MSRFFEDVEPGEVIEIGCYCFTREEIVRFARKYDPQPFHLSVRAGKASPFGGLCASGWHTAAIWMKLMVADLAQQRQRMEAEGRPVAPSGPSPGFRQLKWLHPVFAGDTLCYRITITGKADWQQRPEWGLVRSANEAFNQHGTLVFCFNCDVLFHRRVPLSLADAPGRVAAAPAVRPGTRPAR